MPKGQKTVSEADQARYAELKKAVDNNLALTRAEWEEFAKLEKRIDPDAKARQKAEARAERERARAEKQAAKREKHLNYARANLTLPELKALVKEFLAAEKAAQVQESSGEIAA